MSPLCTPFPSVAGGFATWNSEGDLRQDKDWTEPWVGCYDVGKLAMGSLISESVGIEMGSSLLSRKVLRGESPPTFPICLFQTPHRLKE